MGILNDEMCKKVNSKVNGTLPFPSVSVGQTL